MTGIWRLKIYYNIDPWRRISVGQCQDMRVDSDSAMILSIVSQLN